MVTKDWALCLSPRSHYTKTSIYARLPYRNVDQAFPQNLWGLIVFFLNSRKGSRNKIKVGSDYGDTW